MPIRRKAISTARAGAGMAQYIWLICLLLGLLTSEPAFDQPNNPTPASNPINNSTTGDSMLLYYAAKAIEWLNPAVYLAGLCIAVWAFLRCRKCGYLVMAAYFALAVFWLVAWPPIHHAIRAHRPPDISAQTQQKIDAAVLEATQKVLAEEGHPEGIPGRQYIHFPFGPIILVVGLWLVARHETQRPTPVEQ